MADLLDLKILNRMAYKSIIGQMWLERLLSRGHSEISAVWPEDEVLKHQVHLNTQNAIGLNYYRKEIERCLVHVRHSRLRRRDQRHVLLPVDTQRRRDRHQHQRGPPAAPTPSWTQTRARPSRCGCPSPTLGATPRPAASASAGSGTPHRRGELHLAFMDYIAEFGT